MMSKENQYEEILKELEEAEKLDYGEHQNEIKFTFDGGGYFTLICC